MHNLAIALHQKGFNVTGSDDEIREPSKSRLDRHGLLPAYIGWKPELIKNDIDAIILGMHARKDNPELKKAEELGIRIYSYPEYLYEVSKDKQRIVIGGSHGKTTITSMILHALKTAEMDFDYMVGAQIEGFDTMVRISDAPVMIMEGDEYLSSPIDPRPKFHHYKPDIAVLTGIAWDHINVFPEYQGYVEQFGKFIDLIDPQGELFYFAQDEELEKLAAQRGQNIRTVAYDAPEYEMTEEGSKVIIGGQAYPLQIYGKHNLQNMEAARHVCATLGISNDRFFELMKDFSGANRRLEVIAENDQCIAIKDFAHAPSKLKATIAAVREKYPDRKLIACIELHTFSSLNKAFLPEYKDSMNPADIAIVYYDPKVVEHKKLPPITPDDVRNGFNNPDLIVYHEIEQVIDKLKAEKSDNCVYLLMSSGGFGGQNMDELGRLLVNL